MNFIHEGNPAYYDMTEGVWYICDSEGNYHVLHDYARNQVVDPDTLEWVNQTQSGESGGAGGDVNVTNASLAVTGTFWQETQPVSGTFFQETQPVSGTVDVGNFPETQPVSNVKDNPLARYRIADMDDSGDPAYYGFEAPDGSWYIMENNAAANTFRYCAGSSGYSTAWTGKGALTYGYLSEAGI